MIDHFEMSKLCFLRPQISLRFLGCFPLDKFPKILKTCFAIINTQPMGTLGEHWFLLVSTNDSHGQSFLYFYDNFNRPIQVWFPSIYNRAALQTRCQIKQYLLPSLKNRLNHFVDIIVCLLLIVFIQKQMEMLF